MNEPIPTGKVAFFISAVDKEIYYSVVKVINRYADGVEVIELPRGEPDDFYVNKSLPAEHENYRIVVERSKEMNALQKLGITQEGNPYELLAQHGYAYERTESLEEAGSRELREEHGFDMELNSAMVRQQFVMRPFPVKSNYGAATEYRSFAHIEGNIESIHLQKTPKVEKKSPKRLGLAYEEVGSWANLRQIRDNISSFREFLHADNPAAAGEIEYQQSIIDWLEMAEAAIVGVLRSQRIDVNTTSSHSPAHAMRSTHISSPNHVIMSP